MSSSSSDDETPEFQVALAARLRGQTIFIPDITQIIYKSPVIRLNNTEYLQRPYDQWLAIYVPNHTQRAKQRQINAPLITSYFYSRVPQDKFPVLMATLAWLFVWDDEVDCGSLTLDRQGRMNRYCDDSIAFVRSCMQPELGNTPPSPGRLHNCEALVEIGQAIQSGQSRADRDRYVEALVDYINAVRAAQAQWKVGISPVEEHIERRIGTSAVVSTMCLHAWGYSLEIPLPIWNDEAMQRIIREVCIGVALWNDIISLKKELSALEMDNIIPVLIHHHDVSAQEAVDMVVEILAKSYQDLCAAVKRLKVVIRSEEADVKRDVNTWVDACLDILVGHVAWSQQVPRYSFEAALNKGGDGGFVLVL